MNTSSNFARLLAILRDYSPCSAVGSWSPGVTPQSDLPADWVVRPFDPDDDDDCAEVWEDLTPFRDYPPVASHWLAGDLSILSFNRYKRLFGFHLQIAARPAANCEVVTRLLEHKYTSNSIPSVFVPAQGAWLLAGLNQHSFIENKHHYRVKNWPWLPSARAAFMCRGRQNC